MFQTIGHHTCEDRGSLDDIENHGPFPCKEIGYLGKGHYFWDNHIELAHWWGKYMIQGDYAIGECIIKVELDDFFDLVGNRDDQIILRELIDQWHLHNKPLGVVIEFLRLKKVFLWNVVRAVDLKDMQDYDTLVSFKGGKNKSFTNIAPMYIVCIVQKGRKQIENFRVIFPE